MAYATAPDLEAELQFEIDASSVPTADQADKFLVETADRIDAVLSALGFAVPVTASSPRSLSVVKRLNIYGAAAIAERAHAHSETAGSEKAEKLDAKFEAGLQELRDHPGMLIDLKLASGSTRRLGGPQPADARFDPRYVRQDNDSQTRW